MRGFLITICALTLWRAAAASANPDPGATTPLWLFDDPAGSPVAIDSSGNGHHLTIGAGAAIAGGGKFGNALDADAGPSAAMGAYRDAIDAALNPDERSAWTLECWLRGKEGIARGGDNRIWGISGVNYIDYGRAPDRTGLFVANRFLPAGGAWGWPTGELADADADADAAWHHVAVVYDAERREIRHYFDGKRTHA